MASYQAVQQSNAALASSLAPFLMSPSSSNNLSSYYPGSGVGTMPTNTGNVATSTANIINNTSFSLGNLSQLQNSLWASRNALRRGTESLGDAPLSGDTLLVSGGEESRGNQQLAHPAVSYQQLSKSWNPFTLFPFLHGSAEASVSASSAMMVNASAMQGSPIANSKIGGSISAWSAAAAAAAAAYASLLPAGVNMIGNGGGVGGLSHEKEPTSEQQATALAFAAAAHRERFAQEMRNIGKSNHLIS